MRPSLNGTLNCVVVLKVGLGWVAFDLISLRLATVILVSKFAEIT